MNSQIRYAPAPAKAIVLVLAKVLHSVVPAKAIVAAPPPLLGAKSDS